MSRASNTWPEASWETPVGWEWGEGELGAELFFIFKRREISASLWKKNVLFVFGFGFW